MDTVKFLETILPDKGHYCLFGLKGKKPITKFVPTVDAIVSGSAELSDLKIDAFYAVATFEEVNKGRAGANAKLVKSLWLDLDCGEGKPYATRAEGLRALKAFVVEYKLPKPWLVYSGRGVHVYWPFTRALDFNAWRPLSIALKSACQDSDLLDVDPVPTADIARVLRVPGTYHYKDKNNPKLVELKLEGDISDPEIFKSALPVIKLREVPLFRELDEVTKNILGGSYQSSFQTIVQKSLKGTGCAQLLHMVQFPNDVTEPAWRAGLSVVTRCVNGEKGIHKFSSGHADYNFVRTIIKADKTVGPISCEYFRDYAGKKFYELCDTCVNKGKITSPIVLGKEVIRVSSKAELVVESPFEPPFPYFRGAKGGIFKESKNADGDREDILIYEHDLYVTKRIIDPLVGESFVMKHKLPKDTVKEFTVPLKIAQSAERFKEVLGENGVAADPKQMTRIYMYTTKFVKELQLRYKAEQARTSFGWCDDDKSFLVGTTCYTAAGPEYSSPSSYTKQAAPLLTTAGHVDSWSEIIQKITENCPERTYAFLLSLASPLVKFTQLKGCTVNFVSEDSGTGKTVALQAINSVWGKPQELMLRHIDTFNATHHLFGTFKNLPITIDEVTNKAVKAISEQVYAVTGGRGKHRLMGNTNMLRENITVWDAIIAMTSNAFWRNKLGAFKARPDGELMRLIEIELVNQLLDGRNLVLTLNNNYGWAGVTYAGWLVKNQANLFELTTNAYDKLYKEVDGKPNERYWIGISSLVIASGDIANNLFGLGLDLAALHNFVLRYMISAREEVSLQIVNAETAIGNFLAENYGGILAVDTSVRDPIRGHVRHAPHREIVARIEQDTNKLFISKQSLRAYCAEKQLSLMGLVTGDTGMTFVQKTRKRMAALTEVTNIPAVEVFEFDTTGSTVVKKVTDD
jgi:hypothetical protein